MKALVDPSYAGTSAISMEKKKRHCTMVIIFRGKVGSGRNYLLNFKSWQINVKCLKHSESQEKYIYRWMQSKGQWVTSGCDRVSAFLGLVCEEIRRVHK